MYCRKKSIGNQPLTIIIFLGHGFAAVIDTKISLQRFTHKSYILQYSNCVVCTRP